MNKHIYPSLRPPLVDPVQNQIDSLLSLNERMVDCMSGIQKQANEIYDRLSRVERTLFPRRSETAGKNLVLIKNPKTTKGGTHENR